MTLQVYGLSHHTAPLEVRERLALAPEAVPAAVERLRRQEHVVEALVLSTCNRFEIWLETNDGQPDLFACLQSASGHSLPVATAANCYNHAGRDAVRHIFRVCASLDSMLVGEPQILGQVKQAYRSSRQAGGLGPSLELALSRAFSSAKRIRSDTALVGASASLSHAAVKIARGIFGSLASRTVLLLGAGKIGAAAARDLHLQGAGRLLLANRTAERAALLAAEIQAEALPWDRWRQAGPQADILLNSIPGPDLGLARGEVEHWLRERRQRPILLLDLAVPRALDPAIHQLEQAFLYNLDDLQDALAENKAERSRAAAAAEKLIEHEVDKFLQRLERRDAAPLLRALQAEAERLRQLELDRLRHKFGQLTPAQIALLDELTRGLMRKWLHRPLVELKMAAAEADGELLSELAQRLFGLSPDAADAAEPPEPLGADAAAPLPARSPAGPSPAGKSSSIPAAPAPDGVRSSFSMPPAPGAAVVKS